MSRCFSCGTEFAGGSQHIFTCPTCENVEEIKELKEDLSDNIESLIKSQHYDTTELTKAQKECFERLEKAQEANFNKLIEAQETNFNKLIKIQQNSYKNISKKLIILSNIIEWGFLEIEWELMQQKNILIDIDRMLKTPLETQANELRIMAEKLRNRGVFDEAEPRFIKSIEVNPLDYRTYIGLAHLYLKRNEFIKARKMFEKSLPHGTKELKSHSYKLIGRIYFCEEIYQKAADSLRHAVKLNPNNPNIQYNYAQYSALIGDVGTCLKSLKTFLIAKPAFFHIIANEHNFSSIKHEVLMLLDEVSSEKELKINNKFLETEEELKKAGKVISIFGIQPEEQNYYNEAIEYMNMAKNKLLLNNYGSKFEAEKFLELACESAKKVTYSWE